MADLFDSRGAAPMLISTESEPFDNPDWIFELKLDGVRCLAYLDANGTEIINRRGKHVLPLFPELASIHHQVAGRCILDGELMVMTDGMPDFEAVLRRSGMTNKLRVQRVAEAQPAVLVVFDILYHDRFQLVDIGLSERKDILESAVTEGDRIVLSRVVDGQGIQFFSRARQQGLEGIVAKRKDSLYHMGTRTFDWLKIKNILDDDYIVCGYIKKAAPVVSLVLGQFNQVGEIVYKGRVTLGQSRSDFKQIALLPVRDRHPFTTAPPVNNSHAIWVEPELVCKVKFLARTATGGIRQPVYVGLRPDKTPDEAVEAAFASTL